MCLAFLFSPTKVEVHLGHPLPSLSCKKTIRWSAREELVSLSKVALVIGAIEWQHVLAWDREVPFDEIIEVINAKSASSSSSKTTSTLKKFRHHLCFLPMPSASTNHVALEPKIMVKLLRGPSPSTSLPWRMFLCKVGPVITPTVYIGL